MKYFVVFPKSTNFPDFEKATPFSIWLCLRAFIVQEMGMQISISINGVCAIPMEEYNYLHGELKSLNDSLRHTERVMYIRLQ